MSKQARPLAGRVALVTGASRGIGKGIAIELATAGATVYFTARSITEDPGRPGTIGATADAIAEAGDAGSHCAATTTTTRTWPRSSSASRRTKDDSTCW